MIHGLVGAIRLAEAAAEGGAAEAGLSFNIFWILVSAANFGFFILVIRAVALGPITKMLDERRERIERGLRDAADDRVHAARAEPREQHHARAVALVVLVAGGNWLNDYLGIKRRPQEFNRPDRDGDAAEKP